MTSLGTSVSDLGIAFRTRSNKALSMHNAAADLSPGRVPHARHHPVATGSQAGLPSDSFPTTQLPVAQLPCIKPLTAAPLQLSNNQNEQLASNFHPLHFNMAMLSTALTPSQRGELELAKARAERAAASRNRGHGNINSAGGGNNGSKRHRSSAGWDASAPNTDDDEVGEHSDGELELSQLSPEEQERLLSSRLASGSSTSDKDARRLKRLLRNRVSAQQARERKKQYVSSLEDQIREQHAHIELLEKRLALVEGQNEALRNIIQTMKGGPEGPQPQPQQGAAAAAAAAGGGRGRERHSGAPQAAAGAAAGPGPAAVPRRTSARGVPAVPAAQQTPEGGGSPLAVQPPAQVVPELPPEGLVPLGLSHAWEQPRTDGQQPRQGAPLEEEQEEEEGPVQAGLRQRGVAASRHSRSKLLLAPTAAAAAGGAGRGADGRVVLPVTGGVMEVGGGMAPGPADGVLQGTGVLGAPFGGSWRRSSGGGGGGTALGAEADHHHQQQQAGGGGGALADGKRIWAAWDCGSGGHGPNPYGMQDGRHSEHFGAAAVAVDQRQLQLDDGAVQRRWLEAGAATAPLMTHQYHQQQEAMRPGRVPPGVSYAADVCDAGVVPMTMMEVPDCAPDL